MESDKQIVCVCIVAKRKQKDEIALALQKAGVNLTNALYGKGAVKAGFLQSMFGFVPEENKVVFISMTSFNKADIILKLLVDEFEFDRPNTGIAFTIPVEAVAY